MTLDGTPPTAAAAGPGDSLLAGWYHTIELGSALVTNGAYDHRLVVDRYGFPESLSGKRVLDVGTADGFFAFEMERRGADEVVAMDVDGWEAVDALPTVDTSDRQWTGRAHFELARRALGSRVRLVSCSVYELSPETAGIFDVVFCGSLLLHLHNPLLALTNIRSVTRELAVVETAHDPHLEATVPATPALRFGAREIEQAAGSELGSNCLYWWMNSAGLVEMMTYAGFGSVTALEPFQLPPAGHPALVAHGVP